MKLKIDQYRTDHLSKRDQRDIAAAAKWPFETLNEWEAMLADQFAPPAGTKGVQYFVGRGYTGVQLFDPADRLVLQISLQ